MLRNVALKMLHDQWRMIAIWTVLTGLLAGFYLSLYPSIGSVDEMRQLLDAMPPELRAMFSSENADISTPAGYLNIELFTFMLPFIVMAVTLTAGAGATAGEEEHGTLELLLANPIPRWRIVAEKALGSAILAAILCAGVWVALALSAQLMAIEIAHPRSQTLTSGRARERLASRMRDRWRGPPDGSSHREQGRRYRGRRRRGGRRVLRQCARTPRRRAQAAAALLAALSLHGLRPLDQRARCRPRSRARGDVRRPRCRSGHRV
jgi:hypothetical protein